MNKHRTLIIVILLAASFVLSCIPEFDPASFIQTQRFLGIRVEPLEVAPGETVTFKALVANSDGSQYDGPIAWTIISGKNLRDGEDGLTTNMEYSFLVQNASQEWEFTIPDKTKVEKDLGELETNGLLLSVGAVAFKGGDVQGEPLAAFKSFVISERPEDERMINPNITELVVSDPNGQPLETDEDGLYVTDFNRLLFKAVPDDSSNRYTFHWFVSDLDFEPDLDDSQEFEPNSVGDYTLYCVLRKTYFYQRDDGAKSRLTGMDWARADLRFK